MFANGGRRFEEKVGPAVVRGIRRTSAQIGKHRWSDAVVCAREEHGIESSRAPSDGERADPKCLVVLREARELGKPYERWCVWYERVRRGVSFAEVAYEQGARRVRAESGSRDRVLTREQLVALGARLGIALCFWQAVNPQPPIVKRLATKMPDRRHLPKAAFPVVGHGRCGHLRRLMATTLPRARVATRRAAPSVGTRAPLTTHPTLTTLPRATMRPTSRSA